MSALDTGPADDTKGDAPDTVILKEAMERFKACTEWQGTEDERSRQDTKFANADSRNAWQWPSKTYEDRTADGTDLPCLTINTTRVHNDLIINDICQQDFSPKVRPVAGKASYKAAKMMEALMRRILDQSRYSAQKRKVTEQQVDGGIGHMLLTTRYISERSTDQDIFLQACRDPTGVMEDCWIREPDGSDKNFKFEFEKLPRKEFNRKYPQYAGQVGSGAIDSIFSSWISDKEICLVKYWRKRAEPDTLIEYIDEDGEKVSKLESEIKEDAGRDLFKMLMEQIETGIVEGRTRKTTNNSVEWFLIAGDKIIERDDWAGKYIPGARCVGRELIIDNTLDRKGHTRPLIDAQRMLNYNASTDTQYNFSATKAQWLASARSIEGQEQWTSMNVDNFAVLIHNDIDEEATSPEAQTIEKPQRIPPPTPSPAFQAGMDRADKWMMMISGQWQQEQGRDNQRGPESGRAINARKMQSDTATNHFYDHQSDMETLIGKQLLDLMPKIYDTERALQVIGEKGEKFWIRIDPNQDDALIDLQHEQEDEEAIKFAFNPTMGEFECVSDPGPDYATQRQEAFNALTMVLTQAKELTSVCADLLFKYGDFPGADELMERIQKEIEATKPYLFGKGPPPAIAALNQKVSELTNLNSELMKKLAINEIKHKGYAEKRDIDAQNADTNRMKATVEALTKILLTPAQREQMEHEITLASHQHVTTMIEDINRASLEPKPETEDAD